MEIHELPADWPGGWCDPKRREIVVADGPANRQVRTLVHELGLGYDQYGREQAEVLVDCVTYVVCSSAGLDVGGESIPYVAGWGEDGALEAIRDYAAAIDTTARGRARCRCDTDGPGSRYGMSASRQGRCLVVGHTSPEQSGDGRTERWALRVNLDAGSRARRPGRGACDPRRSMIPPSREVRLSGNTATKPSCTAVTIATLSGRSRCTSTLLKS